VRRAGGDPALVTPAALAAGLARLGVRSGDLLLVHSSLGGLGWIEGGEDAVIDALLGVVGPPGTVCMPTVTFGEFGPRRPPPRFDPASTPGRAGRIPERFRGREGALRSVHPTHSLVAAGPLVTDLVRDHHRAGSPCGPGTPWARIAEAGGTVVLLGVGTSVCTLFHGPEAAVEPRDRLTPPVPCVVAVDGRDETVRLRLHAPYRGAVSDRAAMAPLLEAEGLLRRTPVGAGEALAIDARGLWDFSVRRLEAHPCGPRQRAEALLRHGVRRVREAARARDG
jgi:aminoglycoside 3-N-acetyltransferase